MPPRPRETGHESGLNRIRPNPCHDDRDGAGRLLGSKGRWRTTARHDDVNVQTHQLSREVGEPVELPFRIAALHDEMLTLDVAKVAQTLLEGLAIWIGARATRTEHTDPVHFRRLLGVGGERGREDAEGEGEHEPNGATPHGGVLPNTRALTEGEKKCVPPC